MYKTLKRIQQKYNVSDDVWCSSHCCTAKGIKCAKSGPSSGARFEQLGRASYYHLTSVGRPPCTPSPDLRCVFPSRFCLNCRASPVLYSSGSGKMERLTHSTRSSTQRQFLVKPPLRLRARMGTML